jgi:hypothetical protein
MPDRLPSLIVLVGFWIPPALAGWMAAEVARRTKRPVDDVAIFAVLGAFVVSYTAVWFLINLGRIPSYIPGATTDPALAPPRAVAWLALVASAVVLPGSAIACAVAFWHRRRMLRGRSPT